MHHAVADFVMDRGSNKREARFHSEVRAVLKQFIIGADFDDDGKMKELKPPPSAVWEIRITFSPQHRIFGGFLRPGEFVATYHKDRVKLDKDGFRASMVKAEDNWNWLFPAHCRLGTHDRGLLLGDYHG